MTIGHINQRNRYLGFELEDFRERNWMQWPNEKDNAMIKRVVAALMSPIVLEQLQSNADLIERLVVNAQVMRANFPNSAGPGVMFDAARALGWKGNVT